MDYCQRMHQRFLILSFRISYFLLPFFGFSEISQPSTVEDFQILLDTLSSIYREILWQTFQLHSHPLKMPSLQRILNSFAKFLCFGICMRFCLIFMVPFPLKALSYPAIIYRLFSTLGKSWNCFIASVISLLQVSISNPALVLLLSIVVLRLYWSSGKRRRSGRMGQLKVETEMLPCLQRQSFFFFTPNIEIWRTPNCEKCGPSLFNKSIDRIVK